MELYNLFSFYWVKYKINIYILFPKIKHKSQAGEVGQLAEYVSTLISFMIGLRLLEKLKKEVFIVYEKKSKVKIYKLTEKIKNQVNLNMP
mgnify:CR=1 FL=1